MRSAPTYTDFDEKRRYASLFDRQRGKLLENIATPYYLIDEKKLLVNLKRMKRLRDLSGAKLLLALKCFSTWAVFPLIRQYLDGTTSSGVYEARLGHEEFGGETHAYSVGFTEADIRAVAPFADKIIFNSITQWKSLRAHIAGKPAGVRVNPGFSHSHYDLADPARKFSRLGIADKKELRQVASQVSGAMFHFNCENGDFSDLARNLERLGQQYAVYLKDWEWISLGGGIAYTAADYPLAELAALLKDFASLHKLQVYLEPGEATITGCAELVTTVVDVVRNGMDIAIVDATPEAHMLDHIIYRTQARPANLKPGKYPLIVAGRSCLAGDVFGNWQVARRVKPGDTIRIADAGGYTMVKKTWFNGLPMPAIAVKRLDGRLEEVQRFGYDDFKRALS